MFQTLSVNPVCTVRIVEWVKPAVMRNVLDSHVGQMLTAEVLIVEEEPVVIPLNTTPTGNTLWVVLGLIFGSVLIAIAISIFVRCICRRRRRGVRPADGSDIVGQRVIPATSAPYLCQSPPSYQQGYPNHPPPQYEQYHAYNEGTTISSEPPPHYSAAPEGRSGGVSATLNNYGAV